MCGEHICVVCVGGTYVLWGAHMCRGGGENFITDSRAAYFCDTLERNHVPTLRSRLRTILFVGVQSSLKAGARLVLSRYLCSL